MAKIYLSSTYSDLQTYRERIYQTLRQMRHDVIAMEDYVASDQRPLHKCLADVSSCDLYLGIFAWRYGYIPPKDNPEQKSITELEYRTAIAKSIPRLIFILKEGTSWPSNQFDAVTGEGEIGKRIRELRQHLTQEELVSFFETSDELARLAGSAVHLWQMKQETPSDRPTADKGQVIWNVPFPRNPLFTGRQDILNRLHETLLGSKTAALTQPQAISGLGGIGKTQTALEYAYRYKNDYQAVLWARADTRETLITDIVTIADLLQLPEKDAKDQTLTLTAVKRWLEDHSHWLLILDNADDLRLIRNVLPRIARGGHILLTTRAQSMGRLAQRVEIETMELEEGAVFLLHRANLLPYEADLSHASEMQRRMAKDICQILGSLPLALDQAGAYIEETGCSLSDYLALYTQCHTALLKRRGGLVADHPEPVATTWSLSFEKVQQANPAAADLLRLCAFLHPDAIPEEIITEGSSELGPVLEPVASDPLEWNAAIEALRNYSLIRRDSEAKTLTIHRLVQAVLRDALAAEERKQWATRTVLAVNAVFPEVEFSHWTVCERYLPQALACAFWIEQEQIASLKAARLLHQTGNYLAERGRYTAAEPLYQYALTIYQQELGAEHLDTVASLSNLARLYVHQGKYEQAEPLYKSALAVRERQLGAEHPDTASSLNSLADVHVHQSKYKQAEPFYQRALAIREYHLGAEHPDTASSLNNLAWLYREQGKYEQAEQLLKRALAIRERHLGAEHPNTLASCNNLARLYIRWGKYKQAEQLLKRALATRERRLGSEHPSTASNLNSLAELYQLQGKYEQAEQLLRRALAIREYHLEAEHPDTASSLNNLAWLYREQGKYEQAEQLLKRALAIRERRLGSEHPSTAQSLNNLAGLYVRQGRYEQAEPLYQRALGIREHLLGAEHPSVAISLNSIADLYRIEGRYEQAEPLYQRAIAIGEKTLGAEHPDVAIWYNNLALLYYSQGKYEQAEPLYQQAISIDEKTVGSEHPRLAGHLENYADLLRKMDREAEAAKLEARAEAIRMKHAQENPTSE